MSVRDRRRVGVTFFSVLRATRKVTSNPSFEPSSIQELSEAVLAEIVGKSLPEARKSMPKVDWDAILAFIQKILPLILQLLSIWL